MILPGPEIRGRSCCDESQMHLTGAGAHSAVTLLLKHRANQAGSVQSGLIHRWPLSPQRKVGLLFSLFSQTGGQASEQTHQLEPKARGWGVGNSAGLSVKPRSLANMLGG